MRRNFLLSFAMLTSFGALEGVSYDKKKADEVVVPPRKGDTKHIDLFDGKTLKGWHGYKDLWSVKDGEIVGRNEKPLAFSTYLLTNGKYTDFRLTFSSKLI